LKKNSKYILGTFLLILLSFYVVEAPLSASVTFLPTIYSGKSEDSLFSPAFASTSDLLIINDKFSHPFGVAVDSSGNIYVADTNNNRIEVFDSSGKLLKSIGPKTSQL